MPEGLKRLFSSEGFMPHGHCYLWDPRMVFLHVLSDGLVALAYVTIPFTIFYLVRRRRDVPFNWMFLCFGTFIIACGTTHVMEIWTLWTPVYWLSGTVKAITAVASVATAILLVRLVPSALAIPTAQELARAHEELKRTHDALEARVLERTKELSEKNAELEREIQERTRAEGALLKSETRFRQLSESGILAIVTAKLGGRVQEANVAFQELLGYTAEELTSGDVRLVDLTPPRWLAVDRKAAEELRLNRVARAWEKEFLRKDGTVVPVLVGVAMLQGSDDEYVAFFLDLTERKRAETAAAEALLFRRAKEAAEEANRELEAFSYSVAHDLRSPLRGINGFAGALLEDYGSALDESARGYIERVMGSAERMGEIIDALLGLARLTRTELRREPVDLGAVASAVVEQLRSSDPSREIELVVKATASARGDSRLLRTVLENLLGNAWKFTRGTTSARIEFGTVDGAPPTYYVRDNGAGFDMAYADKLFTPFQRLHSDDFEGSGIGLATVGRIIRRHGGRVWAEGTPGRGATFYFTLAEGPAREEDPSWTPAAV